MGSTRRALLGLGNPWYSGHVRSAKRKAKPKQGWTLALTAALSSVSCSSSDRATALDGGVETGGARNGEAGASGRGGTATVSGGAAAGGASGHSGAATSSGGASPGGTNGTSGAGGTGGAGGTRGGADGGTKKCDGTICTKAQVCIAYRAVGGGLIVPDAGRCPTGMHVEPRVGASALCERDYAYRCGVVTGCSESVVSCACASVGTCDMYSSCVDPRPAAIDLDPSAQLICETRVP
jgi:hypothetical protein